MNSSLQKDSVVDISDFLNPKSMLTPGIAGGLTLLIANTLYVQFAIPQKWSGLTISFLFALIVFSHCIIPIYQRVVYYILNALVIYSVAIGTNNGVVSSLSSVLFELNPLNTFVSDSYASDFGISKAIQSISEKNESKESDILSCYSEEELSFYFTKSKYLKEKKKNLSIFKKESVNPLLICKYQDMLDNYRLSLMKYMLQKKNFCDAVQNKNNESVEETLNEASHLLFSQVLLSLLLHDTTPTLSELKSKLNGYEKGLAHIEDISKKDGRKFFDKW